MSTKEDLMTEAKLAANSINKANRLKDTKSMYPSYSPVDEMIAANAVMFAALIDKLDQVNASVQSLKGYSSSAGGI